MSYKESNRISILEELVKKTITQEEAKEKMGLKSTKQVGRILKRYKEGGSPGLVHKLRGKVGNRKMNEERKKIIEDIIKMPIHRKFKPTFMMQRLIDEYGIKISHETTRKIMIEIGAWTDKKHKREKQRCNRPRRENYGAMQQFDGGYHLRLENRNGTDGIAGEELCLLVSVDDATSNLTGLKFGKNEGKKAVFEFWKDYFYRNGKPKSIYLDRFATYKVNHPNATFDPDMITQFQRVCRILGIEMILARSPQGKGRVERKIGVLEDRLVKEMRLAGINNIDDANKYLEEK